MINATSIFKFLHVLFAMAWVGGGAMMQALAARSFAGTPDDSVQFARQAVWVGNRYFTPAAIATSVFGLGLVGIGHYQWKLWVILGLIGFVITALNGSIVLRGIAGKLEGLMSERGPSDPVVQYTARRLRRSMLLDLVVVVLVVFDMIVKPGL